MWTEEKDWKCMDLIFIRHAESSNNCLYEKIRSLHGTDVVEALVFYVV